MFELLFEFFLEMLFYGLGDVVFGALIALIISPFGTPDETETPLGIAGSAVIGAIFGGLMTLVLPRALLPPLLPVPGLSLLVAPAAAGLVIDRGSRALFGKGTPRPILLTLPGAALFGIGAAAARLAFLAMVGE
ncbi:MAG TPA: hypothetical protein VFX50_06025 [Gemmatimonadales bacterium]|nr:hypothetical protein [Gemmatimonadales bacterium]